MWLQCFKCGYSALNVVPSNLILNTKFFQTKFENLNIETHYIFAICTCEVCDSFKVLCRCNYRHG